MFVALGDSRGVRSAAMQIDGAVVPVLAGTQHAAHPRGFHADVAESFAGARRPLRAEVGVELVGTGELAFAPVGDSTRVALASDWPHPSFAGRFLPIERQVGETGFSARWQLNALATTAPQAAAAGAPACRLYDGGVDEVSPDGGRPAQPCVETFGVAFMDPVSPYVLSDRATKYGLLFIALTFVGVGAVEVLRRLRVHPIQYLLVGSAHRRLLPAPGEPLGARAVRGRLPGGRGGVHGAADVLRLVRPARQPRRRAVRRRHRRPLRRPLRAAAARADRAPARLDHAVRRPRGAHGRDAPDRLVRPVRADARAGRRAGRSGGDERGGAGGAPL